MNSRCTLREISAALPLASIVTAMNAVPTRGHDASAPVSRLNPRPRGRALACFESSLPTTAPLAEHIEEVVAFARARTGAIASLRESCDLDVFCMVSSSSGQGSCILEPGLLAELAALGLPLSLDLYPPSSE